MEQNGLRAQVFRDAAGASKNVVLESIKSVNEFDRGMKFIDRDSDSVTKNQVIGFLAGNSDYSITEIGVENLSDGLTEIENNAGIPSKNDTITNRFFENYVRGKLWGN